jgi:hypothetical protein
MSKVSVSAQRYIENIREALEKIMDIQMQQAK